MNNPRPANWRSNVQRTSHSEARLLHDVRIDLGGRHVLVTEKLLHSAGVRAALRQLRCEGMPQHVRRHPLVQLRPPGRLPDKMLKRCIQHVMSPPHPAARILHRLPAGPEPLPLPLLAGARPFALQAFRQPYPGQSAPPPTTHVPGPSAPAAAPRSAAPPPPADPRTPTHEAERRLLLLLDGDLQRALGLRQQPTAKLSHRHQNQKARQGWHLGR